MKILLYLFTTLLLLSISFTGRAGASYQSGAGTKVQASIPSKVDIRIYGYTSPNSIIQATSIRVFAQVSSDKTGYFVIDPLSISSQAKEICLTTIDSQQRYGFPLCVSLPETDKPTEIGPLLLSPTISLSSGSLVQFQKLQGQVGGQTLPNADVEISFFDNESKGKNLTEILVPRVYAKSIPKLTTKTDKNGNYSINLPSNKSIAYRLFTKSFFDPSGIGASNLPTPKSQTLLFTVSSYGEWWVRNILPRLLILLLFAVILAVLAFMEIKTGKGRLLWAHISETRLKPFGVRSRLAFRRLWYNLREILRSNRI